MTTTYDPFHTKYFDEADLRLEMNRVFDLCHGCRLCFKFCTSFPSLFEMIDRHPDQDSARLTEAEQDRVVDECFGCKLCYVNCPYTPGRHQWELDFPRLMLRAHAVKVHDKELRRQDKIARHVLARTDLMGRIATLTAPVANWSMGTPGSRIRKVVERAVGIHADRLLLPFARQRFSTWFKKRTPPPATKATQAAVTVFPTCLIEYWDPAIGHDLVKVYEHNGVSCELPDGAGCCGAPWLHSGHVEEFKVAARKNVEALASHVRKGNDIVVPQPTCSYVLKKDYPDYIGGPDAELVASHTYDACEYLWKLHLGGETSIDTTFSGKVPATTTYHVACHLQAQNVGIKGRDLVKLTGTKITLVNKCSGIDGTWGYRSGNYDIARQVAKPLGEAVDKANTEIVVGDCHLANGSIAQETGRKPVHPLQLLARAYGIPEEAHP